MFKKRKKEKNIKMWMCVVIGRKKKKEKNPLKSNSLNYRALESFPQAAPPLANQSQQIAALNISDSTDLNKDVMIISLVYCTLG